MRLIFAGTPVFAERALAALHEAGHEVALVLTRPDQPARRGQKLTASPVKQWALARSIPVFQPASLRPAEVQAEIAAVGADLMVVAAYGLILPQAVLDLPRWGCLNIHASLLPRWRGAAPIQRAIEAGDSETGITIMQMDAGLDTGAMRWVCRQPIGVQATGGELHDALAELGGRAVVEALAALAAGTLPSAPQPDKGITYAPDFLINAGGLINVYQEHIGYNKETAYRQAQHIYDVTLEILKVSASEKIHTQKVAMNLAEKRISDISKLKSTY